MFEYALGSLRYAKKRQLVYAVSDVIFLMNPAQLGDVNG